MSNLWRNAHERAASGEVPAVAERDQWCPLGAGGGVVEHRAVGSDDVGDGCRGLSAC
ncbi:hypothetical protein ACGFIR_20830 [Micromonospora sp. NPDC049051]|uniref:hypothetical protein n=1 Tax=Micromonospora sp. NPDC049051 TaxID=3364264 RepID=UPI0037159548